MVSNPLPSRYRIIEEVGQGGMAIVYRAQDETLRREVAVKVLHPHLLAEAESRARLQREARAVAKLKHDCILQIFDYSGDDSLSSFIVTEFIDGQTLKQFLANRKLPVPEMAALIVLEVGDALAHAHSLGIIHRDVKPENVMVRKDGAIKLMDFGVAQVVDLERMTVTGQILGSPAYMAPEVLDGKTLDFRSDIFSLGVMLYQMATGVLPFAGKNPHEVLKRIGEGRFADPRTVSPRVSDHLAKVIARSLARNPNDRYARIALMLDDLCAYVVDAGLENPREELRRFFTAPETYEKGLDHRLATALVASANRRLVTLLGRWSCGTAPWRWNRRTPRFWPSCAGWSEANAFGAGLPWRSGWRCLSGLGQARSPSGATPCGHGKAEMASGSSPPCNRRGRPARSPREGPKHRRPIPSWQPARRVCLFRRATRPGSREEPQRPLNGPSRARRPRASQPRPRPTRNGLS